MARRDILRRGEHTVAIVARRRLRAGHGHRLRPPGHARRQGPGRGQRRGQGRRAAGEGLQGRLPAGLPGALSGGAQRLKWCQVLQRTRWKFSLLPLGGQKLVAGLPSLSAGMKSMTYHPGTVGIPEKAMPFTFNRSWTMTANLDAGGATRGVIATMGIVQLGSSKYWVYYPWSYTLMAVNGSAPDMQQKALLLATGLGAALFALTCYWLGKREVS